MSDSEIDMGKLPPPGAGRFDGSGVSCWRPAILTLEVDFLKVGKRLRLSGAGTMDLTPEACAELAALLVRPLGAAP